MNKPKGLLVLDITALVFLLITFLAVLFYAPIEATMGAVQKVFYFHVACAWAGMLAYLLAAVAGVVYLLTHALHWDRVGLSSVEVGLVFLFAAVISGSIWARPIWNTWWTWDPRLTTTTIMVLAYLAYLMLRQGLDDPRRRARFAAVYAILAFISVPLTFFSIRIYRTIHPVIISGSSTSGMNMTPEMTLVFILSLITFSIIFAALLWHRICLAALSEQVEQLRIQQGQL